MWNAQARSGAPLLAGSWELPIAAMSKKTYFRAVSDGPIFEEKLAVLKDKKIQMRFH